VTFTKAQQTFNTAPLCSCHASLQTDGRKSQLPELESTFRDTVSSHMLNTLEWDLIEQEI